jgi:hypothetical protein
MPQQPNQHSASAAGLQPEPLSNEVLKLKIDDLFHEIEHLKRRLERLEGQPSFPIVTSSNERGRNVVSDPDRG